MRMSLVTWNMKNVLGEILLSGIFSKQMVGLLPFLFFPSIISVVAPPPFQLVTRATRHTVQSRTIPAHDVQLSRPKCLEAALCTAGVAWHLKFCPFCRDTKMWTLYLAKTEKTLKIVWKTSPVLFGTQTFSTACFLGARCDTPCEPIHVRH